MQTRPVAWQSKRNIKRLKSRKSSKTLKETQKQDRTVKTPTICPSNPSMSRPCPPRRLSHRHHHRQQLLHRMKFASKGAVWCLASLCLFAACKTRSDLRREQEIDNLKQQVLEIRGGSRADYSDLSESLKREFIESNNAISGQLKEQGSELDQLQAQMTALQNRVTLLEKKASEASTAKRAAANEDETASLEKASTLYDKGQYEDAIDMIKAFEKKHPKGEVLRKTKYLLAQSYFANKDYALSAIAFSDYRKNYTKDKNIPVVIYHLGMSFEKLGKAKEARLFFQELLTKYPKHPLSKKARRAIKSS